jgi:hypothetical protein
MASSHSFPQPSQAVEPVAAAAARTIALQMLEERGRGDVLVGVAPAKGDGLFLPERPRDAAQAAQRLRPLG